MSKPAAGTALDTGNALYTSLQNAWAILETSGSTLADSMSANNITLDASASIVPNSGNPYLTFGGGGLVNKPAPPATAVTLPVSTSWSVAWGSVLPANTTLAMVAGNAPNTNSFLWMQGTTNFDMRCAVGPEKSWTPSPTYGTYHDFVVVVDFPNLLDHLYVDGVEVGSGIAFSGGQEMDITTLGNGYSGTGFGMPSGSQLNYFYIWNGRALTSADSGTLHTNPFGIFAAGGGGAGPVGPNRLLVRQAIKRASFF